MVSGYVVANKNEDRDEAGGDELQNIPVTPTDVKRSQLCAGKCWNDDSRRRNQYFIDQPIP